MYRFSSVSTRHGIEYPQMTSEKHPDFTCAQRAHQNTLELLPFYLATLFGGGHRVYHKFAPTGCLGKKVTLCYYAFNLSLVLQCSTQIQVGWSR